MTAVDAEPYAVVATAADIICSLRGADLAGWTPPWRKGAGAPDLPSACDGAGQEEQEGGGDARGLAWPAVARGKRSRSRRAGSPSASGSASASAGAAAAASKGEGRKKPRRGARGSPASPLDYSGSGASTSGGEDGAFCSQPAAPAAPTAAAAPPSSKVGDLAGRRSILPVPPPRPAGQRPRKKMRLPEIQQLVRSLSVENDALREEMKALQRACTALSKENGKLETRLDHSSKRNGMISAENKGKPQHDHEHAAKQDARNGFVLPDLNLPADD
ncbi:hypothetical protein C2845_PM10G17350 [Panicum miliaceum]|uniref:BZIP domain-containing protein n=1 Tax=Panicum miliaceum TaxID=4540 RepID=A0A3L6PC00_PANMI|nr:hypothetical protein C2845_PM10G17350 [Panicum miliaceum]